MPGNNFVIGNFKIEQQIMSQWCWAAVAVSIRRFYDPQFNITQRDFVGGELHLPPCSQTPFDFCNQRHSLQLALGSLKVFRAKLDEPCRSRDIISEISNGRPIGCQLVRDGIDGHYIVIKGVNGAGNNLRIEIADPMDGNFRILTLRELLFGYRESQWQQTFFTSHGQN
jgi:hypothetical protein